MRWYVYVAYFFGGAFLANAVPHFVTGITGHAFPSPFATPPGEGESPPLVNVLWGAANLLIGYLLIARVGSFDFRRTRHAIAFGLGALAMAIMLAHHFGRVYAGG
jgi:hypothetical protein